MILLFSSSPISFYLAEFLVYNHLNHTSQFVYFACICQSSNNNMQVCIPACNWIKIPLSANHIHFNIKAASCDFLQSSENTDYSPQVHFIDLPLAPWMATSPVCINHPGLVAIWGAWEVTAVNLCYSPIMNYTLSN